MFRSYQSEDRGYFLALVFLLFPIVGSFSGYYPIWTLSLTAIYALSYLALVFLKDSHKLLSSLLWFYTLAYIIYMTFAYQGPMMWFLFYHVNLLVWRFKASVTSYRFISFTMSTLVVTLGGVIWGQDIPTRLISIVSAMFIFGMYAYQSRIRVEGQLEAEIAQQNRTINVLSAENERNRIGRDLHDTLGHTFAMMTLKTELAIKQLDKEQYEAVRQNLEELNQISRSSMQEVRTIVNQLKYRTVLEEIEEVQRLFELSDISLTVDCLLDLEALSPVIQSTLTMVLRELANNVIKHAQASHCQLSLTRQDGIKLIFEDDGQGFEEITGQELHSIRERLSLLDGEVTILSQSQPTRVQVVLKEGEMQ